MHTCAFCPAQPFFIICSIFPTTSRIELQSGSNEFSGLMLSDEIVQAPRSMFNYWISTCSHVLQVKYPSGLTLSRARTRSDLDPQRREGRVCVCEIVRQSYYIPLSAHKAKFSAFSCFFEAAMVDLLHLLQHNVSSKIVVAQADYTLCR